MNKKIPYASAFVAFILPKLKSIKEIILFGSVARNEDDEKSDIDLFFNIENKKDEEKIKNKIKQETPKFYKSKIAEPYVLKGIKSEIKAHVGVLDEWKLKRSIISDGVVLYGKYKGLPENKQGFIYFNLKPIKNITTRNRVLRKLFGRKEKNYSVKGVVEELNGKILSSSSFVVFLEKGHEIIKFLSSEKLDFSFFEFWSDQIVKRIKDVEG